MTEPTQGRTGPACMHCGRALHLGEIPGHTAACAHDRIDKLMERIAELEAVLIAAGLMPECRS